jgi:purine-binding chemotaxis protein CheW
MQVLLIKIENDRYALNIENIEEIIQKENPTNTPEKSKYSDGIIHYRDNIVPIYNLRRILGYSGYEKQQVELIKSVEKQHIEWVESFEKSITHDAPFTKTLNPSQCELGKWIEKTVACLKCNNKGFVNLIKQHLDKAHKDLHTRGAEVLKIDDKEKKRELFEKEIKKYLVDSLKGLNILEQNVSLLVNAFERIVIYKKDGLNIGFTMDDAERMLDIKDEDFRPTTQKGDHRLINTTKAFIRKGEVIPLIDINMEQLLES